VATLSVQVPDELVAAIQRVVEKTGNAPDEIVSDALLIFFGLDRPER
jgi:hypothetical protein